MNFFCINNLEQQKCSNQYNLLRIAESNCSAPYITRNSTNLLLGITYSEGQKCSTRYNLLGIARSSHQRCFVRKGVFRNFTKFSGKHLRQSLFLNKVAALRSFSKITSLRLLLNRGNVLLHMSARNSKNILLCITYSEQQKYSNILLRITYFEQQKYSTPDDLLRIARFYSVQPAIPSNTRYKNTARVVTDRISSNKFSLCSSILINLSVNKMRMFVNQSFLVNCCWTLNTLYT